MSDRKRGSARVLAIVLGVALLVAAVEFYAIFTFGRREARVEPPRAAPAGTSRQSGQAGETREPAGPATR
jgi:hypothetical protein